MWARDLIFLVSSYRPFRAKTAESTREEEKSNEEGSEKRF